MMQYMYRCAVQKATLDTVDWKSWLHGTGMPPVKPKLVILFSSYCHDTQHGFSFISLLYWGFSFTLMSWGMLSIENY